MKIVFFGTPNYVVPILGKLHKTFKSRAGESPIVAVVTQPPRPTGRKQKLSYSPTDTWAHKKDIKIIRDLDIKKFPKADVGILASYGKIINPEIINHFPRGILNIHPSLLPRWRGASPVQATLVAGDKEAGSTIIKIDELMDHGPIVSQFNEEIRKDDTTETLRARLFERSAEVLTALIEPYLKGKITLRQQEHDKTTFTRLIKKDHGFIPPEYLAACLQGRSLQTKWEIGFLKDFYLKPTPQALERFIRAMQPWPVAWSSVKLDKSRHAPSKRIKILKAHIEKSKVKGQRSKVLELDQVQLEGKNPVSFEQFREAYPEFSFRN